MHQRQVDDRESLLHLGELIQLVEHHLGVGIPAQLNDDAHAVPVRFIPQVGDAVHPFFLVQVGDVLDQAGFVHHIGQLGDHNAEPARLVFFDLSPAADHDAPAPGGIGGADARTAHDDAAGGEIRPFDKAADVLQRGFRVVDHIADGVAHFPHVVRRDIGGHAHGNARRPVDQQVGETGGQHKGFFQLIVKVGHKIHGIFVDVRQHIGRQLCHSGLCITVGGRWVAVNGAEIAVPIDHRPAHGEVLRHAHKRVVHGGIAVRVIFAQAVADDAGALAVRLVGRRAEFHHGIENAALHGF